MLSETFPLNILFAMSTTSIFCREATRKSIVRERDLVQCVRLGMHPMNFLLEITITEAGELPKFSRMVEWNRLWFTKLASRCLLNNSGSNGPSKSLNLMSRYLRSGNLNMTWGKVQRTDCYRDPALK
ncbi:Hypothetical predicted protein [Olea europaea subsp. europaea]|uniref:Uncharacterized protein n=1 Tax=Olea europaea subsp. europaea TaxID=158383 RepID=A0A8S0QJZ1_OLEEU|nr:Hypothetical predicted protein [Olea europaea subsp. europaea]